MDAQSILEIVLKAKNDASKTISGMGKTVNEAQKSVEDLSKSFKIAGGVLVGLGTAGALAMNDWVKSAAEAQTEMARADTILRNTADTVKDKTMTFEALKAETEKVSKAFIKLGFDDEETSNVFAKSLQNTNDVAQSQKLLAATADLARFKGIGLAEAGNAVNMAMMGSGRILKQLGVEVEDNATKQEVLAAIQAKVAGQADAYSKTYKGVMERMTVSVSNLKEALGERLLPIATNAVIKVTEFVERLNELDPKLLDTVVKVTAFATAFSLVVGPILLLVGFLPTLATGFSLLLGPLGAIIGVAALVGGATYLIYSNWAQIQPILQPVFDWLVTTFNQIKGEIMGFVNENLPLFQEAWAWISMAIQSALFVIQGAWIAVWPSLKQTFEGVWTGIKGFFQVVWGAIQMILAVGLGLMTGDWDKALKMMQSGFVDVWNGIKNILVGVLNSITSFLASAINAWIGMINGIIDSVNKITKGNIGKISPVSFGQIGQDNYDYSQAKSTPYDYSSARSASSVIPTLPWQSSQSQTNSITINAITTSQFDWNQVGSQLAFAINNNR